MRGLQDLFCELPDGRAANARHSLADVLLIAFAAMLCGAESCVDFAAFGRDKQDVLSEFLQLDHGVPSHDTFSRTFRLLEPAAFEVVFRRFMTAFAAALAHAQGDQDERLPVLAIDGKSLRGAVEAAGSTTPLHLVTVWSAEQRLVLGQRLAAGRSEVTAAREIIALLDLAGSIVTADALHGSRRTAQAIRARSGDYALMIKGNRGPLHRAAAALFANVEPAAAASPHTSAAHGRVEERRAWVRAVPDWAETYRFDGLVAMARIDARRLVNGQEERQTRYVALSCLLHPDEVLRVVRAHWSIEDSQHWILDVAFGEDRIHTRNDHTAQNLAILRRLALNLLRSDPTKDSIRLKVKKAGWNNSFLKSLLAQMR
ncbi:ISAs1 family transposase [Rhizobium jaguaris]|uniref:ISAs1 family transposase n=1 Tax=Rhizobium jaguaris TaxID=1312183 RepID=A0A387FQY4_9HYPH|nr:ISAs1 family transposase [Rhizobium jaguaris]AYG61198.1 ISAs1 family transposase [Rhizobium jaguaris]